MREAMLHLPISPDEVPPSGQAVQEVARRNLPKNTGHIINAQNLLSYHNSASGIMLHGSGFSLQLLFLFSPPTTIPPTQKSVVMFDTKLKMCCRYVGDYSNISLGIVNLGMGI